MSKNLRNCPQCNAPTLVEEFTIIRRQTCVNCSFLTQNRITPIVKGGLAMFTYLTDHLIEHKGPVPLVCEVSVDPENAESIHFHDALGFKEVGVFASGGKTCRMCLLPDAEGS